MAVQAALCLIWSQTPKTVCCNHPKVWTVWPRHDKTNKMTVHPVKTQISLGIRPVWSESSLSAWRNLESLRSHWAHSRDSDQTGQMPRLIWVFAGRTVILLVLSLKDTDGISNTVDPDQTGSSDNTVCQDLSVRILTSHYSKWCVGVLLDFYRNINQQ